MIWFNLWNHMEVDLIQYRPAFQPPLLGRLTIKKECNNVQLAGQSSWYDPVARVAVLIFLGRIHHNLVHRLAIIHIQIAKEIEDPPNWSILSLYDFTHWSVPLTYTSLLASLFWFHSLNYIGHLGAYICFRSLSEMWARKWPILYASSGCKNFQH